MTVTENEGLSIQLRQKSLECDHLTQLLADNRKRLAIVTCTTEILAMNLEAIGKVVGSDITWAAIQNTAHKQAVKKIG